MAEVKLKPSPAPDEPARPGLKPGDVPPEGLVAKLLADGETDFVIADFPRKMRDGSAPPKVHVRLLSDHEEQNAIANAVNEMHRMLRSGEGKGHPTLEWNLTVRHILAEACRDPEDPRRRFFAHGIVDVRQFTTRELGELWLAYIAVQNAALPSLGAMTTDEIEAWAERVEAGLDAFPFYFSSQENVAAFLRSVAAYVAEKARGSGTPPTHDGTSATGSSGSA